MEQAHAYYISVYLFAKHMLTTNNHCMHIVTNPFIYSSTRSPSWTVTLSILEIAEEEYTLVIC